MAEDKFIVVPEVYLRSNPLSREMALRTAASLSALQGVSYVVVPADLEKLVQREDATAGVRISVTDLAAEYELPIVERDGHPYLDLRKVKIQPRPEVLVPRNVAIKHGVVPLKIGPSKRMLVVMSRQNVFAEDDIKFVSGYNLDVVMADGKDIRSALEKMYHRVCDCNEVMKNGE